ncbi:MAG: hypothetical protein LUH47_08345, partial [Clostridiales bacterium]|nr:hypothetical protein [Clostridiales bacterium]
VYIMADERIIIKGEIDRKRVVKRMLTGAAALFAFAVLFGIYRYIKIGQVQRVPPSIMAHMTFNSVNGENMFGLGYLIAAVVVIAAIFAWFKLGKSELTVSNKRVWGKTDTGKKVDLPINQISSLSYSRFGTMKLNTENGTIKFRCLGNKGMVYTAISSLKSNMRKGSN